MAAKGQTKYRREWPQKLIDLMSRGYGFAEFCDQNNISDKGFYLLIKKHPEFAEAYEVGKMKSRSYLEKLAMDHLLRRPGEPQLDTRLWSILMRNRHRVTSKCKVAIKGIDESRSAMGQYQLILKGLAEGKLTAEECLQLVKTINVGADVYEKTELVKTVEELERERES